MDDLLLLCGAVALVAFAVLYRELSMDYTALNAQVDATLQTMAAAVAQLQLHVADLTKPDNDAAAVAAIVARLKAGTDTLAAGVVVAQKAFAAS